MKNIKKEKDDEKITTAKTVTKKPLTSAKPEKKSSSGCC